MIYQGVRDLPIYYWDEADKTGDLSNILIYNNPITRFYYQKLRPKYLQRRWKQIKDDFFNRIALDTDLEKYLLKKKKLAVLLCDIYTSKTKAKSNLLRTRYLILKREIEGIEGKAGNNIVTLYKQKDALEKYKGFFIDLKNTSVMEFFEALGNMSEQFKEQKRQADKLKGRRRK